MTTLIPTLHHPPSSHSPWYEGNKGGLNLRKVPAVASCSEEVLSAGFLELTWPSIPHAATRKPSKQATTKHEAGRMSAKIRLSSAWHVHQSLGRSFACCTSSAPPQDKSQWAVVFYPVSWRERLVLHTRLSVHRKSGQPITSRQSFSKLGRRGGAMRSVSAGSQWHIGSRWPCGCVGAKASAYGETGMYLNTSPGLSTLCSDECHKLDVPPVSSSGQDAVGCVKRSLVLRATI